MLNNISNTALNTYYETLTTKKLPSVEGQESTPFAITEKASSEPTAPTNSQAKPEQEEKPIDIMQLLLDARLGIDREKLEEIEEKIALILNDPNLSDELKQEMIESLEEQKEAILERAKKFMALD